jgi:hypothetical protein
VIHRAPIVPGVSLDGAVDDLRPSKAISDEFVGDYVYYPPVLTFSAVLWLHLPHRAMQVCLPFSCSLRGTAPVCGIVG